MLLTMLDLTWTVRVERWTWMYTFSSSGSVRWLDPSNKLHGAGTWKVSGDIMTTRWANSKTVEEWDVPIDPEAATGVCRTAEGAFPLKAVAEDYYLRPGDVAKVGGRQYVVYAAEVRQGGTIAWKCCNPGNIRYGDRYGSIPGKRLQTAKGPFSIFPDEDAGWAGLLALLKESYAGLSILDGMKKYAPESDGNNPVAYANSLAHKLKLPVATRIGSLTADQLEAFATEIKRIEGWEAGRTFGLYDDDLPAELSLRIPPRRYPCVQTTYPAAIYTYPRKPN